MKLIRTSLWMMALACCMLSTIACAQGPRPNAPMPPSMGGVPTARHYTIGPSDSMGSPRKLRGKCSLLASPSPDAKPASAEFFVDGKSVGTSTTQPFVVEFDSTTVSDGEHTVKAVGRDTSGKEVWSATLRVDVVNGRSPRDGMPSSVRPRGLPPAPGTAKLDQPRNPAKPDRPAKPKKGSKEEARAAAVAAVKLDRTYSNDDYGFSIRYPGKWTFQDKTVMLKPRTAGGFWVAFAEYPIEKAKLVVNVKRASLQPGTDADTYARHNDFVRTWERKTVLGSPAFCTTSKVGMSGQIVHRIIVVKDGYAWMLNCEDSTGKSPDDSAATFEAMVNSIRTVGAKKAPAKAREERPRDRRPAPEMDGTSAEPPPPPPPAPPVTPSPEPPPAPTDEPAADIPVGQP